VISISISVVAPSLRVPVSGDGPTDGLVWQTGSDYFIFDTATDYIIWQ
jgi:hypothetical protein